MKRLAAVVAMGACLLMAWVPAASAGGWVVISLDEVPASLEAGATSKLGFTVLAHGKTPIDVGDTVEIRFAGDTGTHTFEATRSGKTGHYTVDVTVPEAGEWRWEVAIGPYAQRLETIHVTPTSGGATGGPLLPVVRTVLPVTTVAMLGVSLLLFRRIGSAGGAAADAA